MDYTIGKAYFVKKMRSENCEGMILRMVEPTEVIHLNANSEFRFRSLDGKVLFGLDKKNIDRECDLDLTQFAVGAMVAVDWGDGIYPCFIKRAVLGRLTLTYGNAELEAVDLYDGAPVDIRSIKLFDAEPTVEQMNAVIAGWTDCESFESDAVALMAYRDAQPVA